MKRSHSAIATVADSGGSPRRESLGHSTICWMVRPMAGGVPEHEAAETP